MTSLADFQELAAKADKIDWTTREQRAVALMGALGEYGSVVAELKKRRRDTAAYTGFSERFGEELGDLLWYIAAIARHRRVRLADLETATSLREDEGWFSLGQGLSELASLVNNEGANEDRVNMLLGSAAGQLRKAAADYGTSLEDIADQNLKKTRSRWEGDPASPAPCSDRILKVPAEERLPRQETIDFIERERPKGGAVAILRCRGISVGDRLTDNAHEDDGYRFHDAFHLAHAAILGWSPVMRSLFRCKRKSKPEIDEVEDGARAVIAEESVSFLTFDYARRHNYFDGVKRVDQDLIRHIQSVVCGLEVAERDRWEWEHVILHGYSVFRKLNDTPHGGVVRIDAEQRLIKYVRDIEEAEVADP